MGLMAPSATLTARAWPFFTSSWRAMNSGIAAQQNIGSAAGHVGGDGHHPQPPGLGHNLRFALVELCVQHHVAYALALQNSREPLRLFDRRGAHQHRLLLLVQLGNVLGNGLELCLLIQVNNVGIFKPPHRLVGGDHNDFELVDLFKLGRFSLRRAGHAAQLLIEAKIILKGDGGQRLIFLADGHAFLGFDGLVQPV